MTKISKDTIRAYALKNAIKYNGKANQGAILAGLFAEGLDKSRIKEILPEIQKVLKEINKLSLKKQISEASKTKYETSKREIREGLKELPNAKRGKVIMRMAPFPSGPLHIGNARTFILNDEYVKEYKGQLLLVMDDTIGSEEKQIEPEAYKLIEDGIRWLEIKHSKKIIYKSDRIKKYYEYAEEMLKKGYLYVCHCSQEKMHELRMKGIECACRNLPPEEQMKRWDKMFKAKMGSMTVRLKTSMQDPDPAFRDRVMFKISNLSHPRTKKEFRVYPSMEFSWGIDDHLFGVTHVLRGIDHQMSTRVQNFIRGIFGWENPESIYNGHFEIEGIKISKSKGTQEIKSGKFSGWNDPRTWSLQSLKDRGIQPEAIREFILNLGMKKTNIKVPIESLYVLNKKLLENAQRYFFIERPKRITIEKCPKITAEIPFHPNGELGTRKYQTNGKFLISKKDLESMEDGNYRLMHLLNFNFKKPNFIFESEHHKNNSKTKFIHWLPEDIRNIDVEIIMPDGSLIKGKGEPALAKLKAGTSIKFERFGFVTLNKTSKDKLEFYFAHD